MSRTQTWICVVCTYKNPSHQHQCEMCGNPPQESKPIVKELNEVKEWLFQTVKLPQYWLIFEADGYDSFEIVKSIQKPDELPDAITKKGHQIKLMQEINKLRQVSNVKPDTRTLNINTVTNDNKGDSSGFTVPISLKILIFSALSIYDLIGDVGLPFDIMFNGIHHVRGWMWVFVFSLSWTTFSTTIIKELSKLYYTLKLLWNDRVEDVKDDCDCCDCGCCHVMDSKEIVMWCKDSTLMFLVVLVKPSIMQDIRKIDDEHGMETQQLILMNLFLEDVWGITASAIVVYSNPVFGWPMLSFIGNVLMLIKQFYAIRKLNKRVNM